MSWLIFLSGRFSIIFSVAKFQWWIYLRSFFSKVKKRKKNVIGGTPEGKTVCFSTLHFNFN